MDILVILGVFLLMEGVTWCTHKYVMHGFLWYLHKDHHDHSHADKWWERNDAFFVIFALPSMALIIAGTSYEIPFAWQIGAGIAMYGLAYFLVHDVFIHQRFRWLRRSDNPYFRALRKAHKIHHKHLGKEEGECFGMLMVPFKYFRKELDSVRS